MESWVALLDCNNFFVSCERLFRPDLKRKPVAVLSSNDGCVVARSQEIKDIGVPMGVPLFQIKDIIKDKDVTTFSSHFALYRDVSRRVFEVLRREMGSIEQYSIDEAFFILEGEVETVALRAKELKDIIEQEVGVPVSIGVAKSKTIAKYASTVAKKTKGVKVLPMDEWTQLASKIELREIWGVGAKTSQAFREKGLSTVFDLVSTSAHIVQQLFGVHGTRLQMELSGVQAVSISRTLESQKSILHTRSFKQTTTDIEVLKDAIAYHLGEAALDLRSMGLLTKVFTVYLGTSRHGDYLLRGGSKTIVLQAPTNDTFMLLAEATKAVEVLFESDVPYKKAGVMLTEFSPKEGAQMNFFEAEKDSKTTALIPMLDAVNERIGKGSVILGTRLKEDKWQSSQIKRSPAYTTNWKQIATVKA
jgi:DNA polymerase V